MVRLAALQGWLVGTKIACTCTECHTCADLFSSSISLIFLLLALSSFPAQTLPPSPTHTGTSNLLHRWLYGKTFCSIYAFCGILFGICSLTTLTLLSMVCFVKVCYPLYGKTSKRSYFSHSEMTHGLTVMSLSGRLIDPRMKKEALIPL